MKDALNMTQEQRQVQRLMPRQVQLVRLLEMPATELEEEVRRQLDDNPALEAAEQPLLEPQEQSGSDADDYGTEGEGNDAEAYGNGEGDSYGTGDDAYDGNDPYDGSAEGDYGERRYIQGGGTREAGIWQIEDDSPDLHAQLEQQIRHSALPEEERDLAIYIIGNLDENGYLTRSLSAMADDIAIETGLDVSPRLMEAALRQVRELDPPGVGAIDLRDCLLLQLQRMGKSSLTRKIAIEIVRNHFTLFSNRHYDRLAAALGLEGSPEELDRAIEMIRTLNPNPGSAIAASASAMRQAQITPDVAVERGDDGRYTVALCSQLPHLQIARTFSIDTGAEPRTASERDARAFIRAKRDEAEAFIWALRQRGRTLLEVTEAIVKRQPEFFETGQTSRLRPMILKDISADTGLDISAISRATQGKYVATDLGVYPLKMFFNEAPTSGDASSHQLMDAIKGIVEEEDKRRPLSDEAIQEKLRERGYELARRTVAKYREKLGIPVGRLRRDTR